MGLIDILFEYTHEDDYEDAKDEGEDDEMLMRKMMMIRGSIAWTPTPLKHSDHAAHKRRPIIKQSHRPLRDRHLLMRSRALIGRTLSA